MKYTLAMYLDSGNIPAELPFLKTIKYDKNNLQVFIVANAGENQLSDIKNSLEESGFPDYEIFSVGQRVQKTFVYNLAGEKREGEYIVFMPFDSVPKEDFFDKLDEYIEKYPKDTAVFIPHTYPYDTNRHINAQNLKMWQVDLDCFVTKKEDFLSCGGIDTAFEYGDGGKEFAVRILAAGKTIRYCPKCRIEVKICHSEKGKYIKKCFDPLLLAKKYGDSLNIKTETAKLKDIIKSPLHFENIRKDLLKIYLKTKLIDFSEFRKNEDLKKLKQISDIVNTQNIQRGNFAVKYLKNPPLISVVVRTHNRVHTLIKTLKSIENQSYENFEVIVVEDGENTREYTVLQMFKNLNIRYKATQTPVGRGKAGNIGIEMAKGDLVALLDDDDFYYPDFLETFAYVFSENPQTDLLISGGGIFIGETAPDSTMTGLKNIIFDHITLMDMCTSCRVVSCSSAMFKKQLFNMHGGLREDIDGDEDWAMWLKFLKTAKRSSETATDIPRSLMLYRRERDENAANEKLKKYKEFDKIMLSHKTLSYNVTVKQLKDWGKIATADILHLKNLGLLKDFVKNTDRPFGISPINYDEDNDEAVISVTAKQLNSHYWYIAENAINGGKIT
jgi:glycosyltransferase involved in cell wall biosynthesis